MALLAQLATKSSIAVSSNKGTPIPVVHPSYMYLSSVPGVAKPGVMKQAAENFKWGR